MQVILQQDVKGQGKKGELVEVSEGYARNYLLPRKLAVKATADNLNAMKLREKAHQAQIAKEKQQALDNAAKLAQCEVKVVAKAGANGKLFGAVTSKEIVDALNAQFGIELEKNQIVQGEPIKNYGSYEIKCKLGHEVNGLIRLTVAQQ